MKLILGALMGLMLAATASADSVWTYSGNAISGPWHDFLGPNPCGCALSGSVAFDALGNATSWDFTDGTHELTNLNSTGRFSDTGSIMSGSPFSEWAVDLTGAGIYMFTGFYGSNYEATDGVLLGNSLLWLSEEGNKGVWVDGPVPTTEPASLLLLGAGLAALAFKRRRKPADTSVWETLA